jgi:Fe-S-cluster containining protein
MADEKFACTACGLCCRQLAGRPWYADLDRGDGVCRHLNDADNQCKIYESRPVQCRMDALYDRVYATRMSRAAYYARCTEGCQSLAAQQAADYSAPG